VANWDIILLKVPEVDFLLPNDMGTLIEVLNKQYNIKVEFDNGLPKELGRVKNQ
jgi:hypothetical protein